MQNRFSAKIGQTAAAPRGGGLPVRLRTTLHPTAGEESILLPIVKTKF
ncbi:hypothetical protein BN938_0485 [Mucinivorans hirudinis]|uniref:Uncharacterized protein n=1 Tax=Mucinivorans hirudinis TaxID=1433126 RepID=A0A060R6G9_9BACT|nr:hypothetical protein BN938_0485 [Mucinivorans hirudinis]